MIIFIARLFGISTLLSTLITWTAIAALAWGVWAWRYHSGVVAGREEIRAEWAAAREAEKDRVAKAIAEAQAEAQKTIDELEKREEELNEKLEQALADDAKKPDPGGCGISDDSVQFLNGIR